MRILLRVAPVAVAFAPKCPLCLLPLAAAFGVTLPSSRVLTMVTFAIVLTWVGFIAARGQLVLSLGAGSGAASVLLGRSFDVLPLTVAGTMLVLGVALCAARRRSRCDCR